MAKKRFRKAKGNVVDSVAEASSITGIPSNHIAVCKHLGAPKGTFPGSSRVNIDLLVPFYEANRERIIESAQMTIEGAEIRYKMARAARAEREESLLARESIPAREVDEQGSEIGNVFRAKLMSMFVTEMPAKVAGMGEIEIRERMLEAVTNILSDLHNRATWYRQKDETQTAN